MRHYKSLLHVLCSVTCTKLTVVHSMEKWALIRAEVCVLSTSISYIPLPGSYTTHTVMCKCFVPPLDLKKDKPSEESKPEASSTMQKPTEQGQQLTAQQQEEEKEEEEASQPQSRVVEDQSTNLPSVLEEEEDPLEAASKLPWEEDARIGRMEKTFSTLAIERILGLLVATLPQELSVRSLASLIKPFS